MEKSIADIEIISEKEKKQVLEEFNDTTTTDYPTDKTIHRLFREQAEKNPHHVALAGPAGQITKKDNSSITYRQLNEKSNQLAWRLSEEGVTPDTVVAIMIDRSPEMITGILGILKVGGAYLPIDPEYPEDRVNFMLRDSGARVLLSESSKLSELSKDCMLLDIKEIGKKAKNSLAQPAQPAQLSYIIYTSGSTGKPKGVMIEHKNVVRLLFNDKFQFDFNDDDVWSLFHSFSFDFSVWEMYGALLYGGRLVIIPPMTARNPGEFLDILKRMKATVLNQTPSAFYRLVEEELKHPDKELNIRYVIFGGEALKPGKLAAWRKKYPAVKLVNMYGITETTVHVTYKEIRQKEIDSGISNIGRPIPTLSVYVMDPGLNLQPIGVPGQCCVGGEGVGRGYLNRVRLTAEKFVDNPYSPGRKLYLSGDLVKLLSNGEMEYLGRIDHQVKIRGFRVELGEIEKQLLKQADTRLKDALVVMKEDKDGDGYLCAYIVPLDGDIAPGAGEIDIERLRNDLSQILPAYMIPSYFVRLDRIPLTPNGKIDKSALPEPRMSSGRQYVPPRDQREQKLAEIWQRILGAERVGIDEDFFFLGGDSIKALRLVSAINDELNGNLKLIDLYTSGTIEKLTARLNADKDIQRTQYANEVVKEMERLKARIMRAVENPEAFEDIFPMSDIQEGMVFSYMKYSGAGVYHDQFAYSITYNNFQLKRLKQALKLMVKKHGMLRTSFNIEDFDEPVQMVRKKVTLNFRHQDISRLNTKKQQSLIETYLKQDLETPFQADDETLWRVKVFLRGGGNIVLLFICHHAILDGWSIALMMSELHNTYLRLKTAPGYIPSPLGCGYKNSVIEEILDKRNPQTIQYWKSELEDYKRVAFTETLKEDESASGMKIYQTIVGGEILSHLRHLTGVHDTGLKHVFFSAYVFVMGMLTHERDLVVGIVTNNRPVHEDADKIFGCFLNTVPVRMKIPTNITWADYLKMVDRKLQEVRRHERFPLFEIARVVEEKNKDRNPFFDTLLNFTDFHILRETDVEEKSGSEPGEPSGNADPDVNGGALSLSGSQNTNTLFDFEVDITSGVLLIHPKYVPSIISDEVVQKSCVYFEQVLNKFINEPETLLRKNDILPPEEKQKLLVEFNDTALQYSTEETMHGLFQEQVERTPHHIAVLGAAPLGMAAVTYRHFNEKTNQLAHMLQEKGVTPGDLVAVIMNRSIHMAMAVMGILKAGGAYVPLEPYLPDTRIQKILDSLKVNVLLTDDKEYRRVERMCESLEALETILCPGGKDRKEMLGYSIKNPNPKVTSVDFAYTIFTSGSTGTPKGVVEMHRPVVNVIQWVNRTFNVGQPDKLLFVASLGFDLSVYDIFGILASGACVRVVEADDIKSPERLLEIIMGEGITFWDSAPAALQQLVPFLDDVVDGGDRHSMRLVFLSGDWIPVTLPDALKAAFLGVRVISLGGATEATIWSNFHPILEVDPRWPSIPYGKPIQNAKYYILDQHVEL
ncbi:MAG: amino acid adenylation domain-containing protein, partial [bacterium]|nr:amino acid adenylation domain-containing protein [bacterium]